MSILRNTTRHKITSIVGVILMSIGASLWLASYLTKLEKDFGELKLAIIVGIGTVLLFAKDDLILSLTKGVKNVINKKTS